MAFHLRFVHSNFSTVCIAKAKKSNAKKYTEKKGYKKKRVGECLYIFAQKNKILVMVSFISVKRLFTCLTAFIT